VGHAGKAEAFMIEHLPHCHRPGNGKCIKISLQTAEPGCIVFSSARRQRPTATSTPPPVTGAAFRAAHTVRARPRTCRGRAFSCAGSRSGSMRPREGTRRRRLRRSTTSTRATRRATAPSRCRSRAAYVTSFQSGSRCPPNIGWSAWLRLSIHSAARSITPTHRRTIGCSATAR
jgi:hypothetical protein